MNLHISTIKGLKLYNNLSSIEDSNSFYIEHEMRHPRKTLENKISALSVSLDNLLAKMSSHNFDPEKHEAISNYLQNINHLYDGLLLIMKATTKPNPSNKNETDIKKWLSENNHKAYTSFKDSTVSHHNFIRKASNLIKHDDVKIDYLYLKNHKGKKVEGFYLSKIVDNKQLSGSISDIHKEYKGSPTAFSFNHFLLRTMGVIALLFYQLNRIIFSKKSSEPQNGKMFLELFRKVSNLKEEFFPDEYGIAYAKLIGMENSVTLSYPHRYKRKEKFDNITSVHPTFEFSQPVQFPYFKLLKA